jgi:xylulokinase
MEHVVGVDTSTTATKAVIVDQQGAVVAEGAEGYGYDVPRSGWSEQDPELWWTATTAAIRAALRSGGVDPRSVAGVGLTGQMHGLVLLDRDHVVLRPAILWNDQRTARQCDDIRALLGAARLVEVAGNDAMTGFTAPKLLWVRDEEPEIYERITHVLLPKDHVRLQLTGDLAGDKADGSGTLLFDVAKRDWSPEMLQALNIDPTWLPPTYEGPEVTGVVSPSAAEIPLVPRKARSMTSCESMSTAQWSTVARVRPRIRPPSSSTVTVSLSAIASAASSEEVTTVSSRSASRSAISLGVKPSSM